MRSVGNKDTCGHTCAHKCTCTHMLTDTHGARRRKREVRCGVTGRNEWGMREGKEGGEENYLWINTCMKLSKKFGKEVGEELK